MSTRSAMVAAVAGMAFLFVPASAGATTTVSFPGVADPPSSSPLEVQSFSWGVSNQGSHSSGGGGGAGKAVFQDINFTISSGKSSPKLMEAVAKGKHFPSVLLSYRADDGSGFGIDGCVKGAALTKFQLQSDDGSARPMESLSINYTKIQWTYSIGGESARFFWDLKKGTGGITDEITCQ